MRAQTRQIQLSWLYSCVEWTKICCRRLRSTDSYYGYYYSSRYSKGITVLLCLEAITLNLSKMMSESHQWLENISVESLLQNHMEDHGVNNSIVEIVCHSRGSIVRKCIKLKGRHGLLCLDDWTIVTFASYFYKQRISQYRDLLYFCHVRWLSRGVCYKECTRWGKK